MLRLLLTGVLACALAPAALASGLHDGDPAPPALTLQLAPDGRLVASATARCDGRMQLRIVAPWRQADGRLASWHTSWQMLPAGGHRSLAHLPTRPGRWQAVARIRCAGAHDQVTLAARWVAVAHPTR